MQVVLLLTFRVCQTINNKTTFLPVCPLSANTADTIQVRVSQSPIWRKVTDWPREREREGERAANNKNYTNERAFLVFLELD